METQAAFQKNKRCSKCKEILPSLNFGKNQRSKANDGLHPECRSCVKERKALFYLKNKFRLNTAEKEKKKIRRKKDPQMRIKESLRARLGHAVRGRIKAGSAIKDLGCTVEELRLHLESQFRDGMDWNNYGNKSGMWSIDHILPISKFDLTDRNQFLKVCHYTNLQPLWVEENLLKGNTNG